MKRIKNSLRIRISLWYTAFMLIIATVLLIAFYETHQLQLRSSIENNTIEVIADTVEKMGMDGDSFMYDRSIDFYKKNVYVSVYDEEGNFLVGRRPADIREYPDFQDKLSTAVKANNGENWYIYDSRFDIDGTTLWLRGVSNEGSEASTSRNTMTIILILLPLLVLVAFVGGLTITKRGFKPVIDIVNTANEIREKEDLSKRIELEDNREELDMVAESVNAMLDRLETLVEQQKQFTSDVSHELRTPVAVIRAQSENAMTNPEDSELALKSINAQAIRMQNLLSRLLLLTRSDAGTLKLERERFNLSEIVSEIAEQQSLVAEEQGLKISSEIEADIEYVGDELMLMRVILNLVDNAIKYTKGIGKEIHIGLRRDAETIVCSVSDDGPGIAEEEREKIWNRFYRVNQARSEDGSSGLGLSMVDSITRSMGGSVRLKSEIGKGSCFEIVLPERSTGDER